MASNYIVMWNCQTRRVILLILGFLSLAYVVAAAQETNDKPIFLVARRELADPLFKQSVVLMLPSADQDVVIGLIVNRPTRIKLGEVFPEEPALKDRSDAVYFGGPVDDETLCALFLSSKPFEQAVRVIADLYISFDSDFIKEILKDSKEVTDVRLFLGRAQWDPEQLNDEVIAGAWYSERAESSLIFSHEPEKVWRTLIERLDPGTVAHQHEPPRLFSQAIEPKNLLQLQFASNASWILPVLVPGLQNTE